MSKFTGALKIEEVKPGLLWKTLSPVVYEVSSKGSGKIIEIPAGFNTDGASVPYPIKMFIAVWGTYGRAALVHDYLYALLKARKPHIYASDRKQADKIFLEAMKVLNTGFLLRYSMYYAVRLFGGKALRKMKNV